MSNKINLQSILLNLGGTVAAAIYTSTGEPVCVVDSMGEIGNKKADEEVARRIVASWNACKGMTFKETECLALHGKDLLVHMNALIDDLELAIERVQIANQEGNPIMSAWRKDAAVNVQKAKALVKLYKGESPSNKCSACGVECESIIGCPSGAELCQACFDGGAA